MTGLIEGQNLEDWLVRSPAVIEEAIARLDRLDPPGPLTRLSDDTPAELSVDSLDGMMLARLASHADLQTRYFRALWRWFGHQQHNAIKFSINFLGLQEASSSLLEADIISMSHLDELFDDIGTALAQNKSLEILRLFNCTPFNVDWAATVLRNCQQIKTLLVAFPPETAAVGEADDFRYLSLALNRHSSLERVVLRHVGDQALRSICQNLPRNNKFAAFGISGNKDKPYIIASREQAMILRDVALIPTLKGISFACVQFASTEAISCTSSSWARCRLLALGFIDVTVPLGMEKVLVDALVKSPVAVMMYMGGNWLPALCTGLAVSCIPRHLVLGVPDVGSYLGVSLDQESVCQALRVLRHGKGSGLKTLILIASHWSLSADEALAAFMRDNECVTTLSIRLDGPEDCECPSNRLLAAAESSKRVLESATFFSRRDMPHHNYDLDRILHLNKQRKTHDPLFDIIGRANPDLAVRLCLPRAVRTVDRDTLFALLQRKELDLLALIEQPDAG